MSVGICYDLVNGSWADFLQFLALGIAPIAVDQAIDRIRIRWPKEVKITIDLRW